MKISLEEVAQQLIDAAKKCGAESADAIIVEGSNVSIDVRNGKLEQAESSQGIEAGLRVIIEGKSAISSSSNIDLQSILQMATRATDMAKESIYDPNIGLADSKDFKSIASSNLELAEAEKSKIGPVEYEELALKAEAAALSVDGVNQCQSSSAGGGRSNILLATSNGFCDGYSRSMHSISCTAISGENQNMERDYAFEGKVHFSELPTPEEIGELAGTRSVRMIGARKPPTGAFPVIFDERISGSLIGHILSAINGSSIARGSSWLLDAMGKQIIPKGIDLIENPLRPKVSGSRPFDGEGLFARKNTFVRNGVLESWVLDLHSARKLGLSSTGNATRSTSSQPSPSVGNLEMTQGKKSLDELISDAGKGFLVCSMIGSSINQNTGDYSRGASGFWFENGEICYPVNECTIAGNLKEMALSMMPANDGKLYKSRIIPSILVEGLTIAGN